MNIEKIEHVKPKTDYLVPNDEKKINAYAQSYAQHAGVRSITGLYSARRS